MDTFTRQPEEAWSSHSTNNNTQGSSWVGHTSVEAGDGITKRKIADSAGETYTKTDYDSRAQGETWGSVFHQEGFNRGNETSYYKGYTTDDIWFVGIPNSSGVTPQGSTERHTTRDDSTLLLTVRADTSQGSSSEVHKNSTQGRTIDGTADPETVSDGDTTYPTSGNTTSANTANSRQSAWGTSAETVATLTYETTRSAEVTLLTTVSGTAYQSDLGDTSATGTTGTWSTSWTQAEVTETTSTKGVWSEVSDLLTSQADFTSWQTEVDPGDTTDTRYASGTITKHHWSPLVDTVIALNADFDEWYDLGHALWLINSTAMPPATGGAITGVFSDLYSLVTGSDKLTLADYRQHWSTAITIGTVALSKSYHAYTDSAGVGHTEWVTLTNGVFYQDTDATTETHASTRDLGATLLGTSIRTGYYGASSNGVVTTQTDFTYVDQVSGYETSGAREWTTGTSTGYHDSTSTTGTHVKWASLWTSTETAWGLGLTTDTTLVWKYSVVGTGDDTTRIALGKSQETSSRVYSHEVTLTASGWSVGIECMQWASSTSGGDSDWGLEATSSSSAGYTISEDHAVSYVKTARMLPRVESRSHDAPPAINQVWFTAQPAGLLGFAGSFSAPDSPVYLTTESGKAEGEHPDTASLELPGTALLNNHWPVSLYPIDASHTPTLAGPGLSASSVREIPDALTTQLTVDATWSTTYASGTSTATSTMTAAYTVGMLTPILGEFVTCYDLEENSYEGNVGAYGGTFMEQRAGYGAGDFGMDDAATVYINSGMVSYTLLSGDNTAGIELTTSGLDGSVSFTIPDGYAMVWAAEPVLTARWSKDYGGDHIRYTTPYQSHDL